MRSERPGPAGRIGDRRARRSAGDRLRAEAISHGYGSGADRVEVLRGVDLAIASGERVGLAGPSGAGKSTLAYLMAMLAVPDAGRVVLDGSPVGGAGIDLAPALRRRVQLLWQAPRAAVDPRHRLDRIILEPLRLHGEAPADRSARRALLVEIATEVGLTADLLGRRSTEVSDGQLQRACVARALLLRPDVLVADEPSAMLDVSTQAALLDTLRARTLDGMGVLLISHDTELLTHWCDRVVTLRDGRLEPGSAPQGV